MKFQTLYLVLIALLPFGFSWAQAPEKTKTDTNREVIRTYVKVYNELGQYQQSDDLITGYVSKDDTDGSLWILLGQTQILEKKFSQACYAFQKAATLTKNKKEVAFAEYSLADCLNQGGKTEDSKTLLRKVANEEKDFSDSAGNTLSMLNSGTILSGSAFPAYQNRTPGKWRVSAAMGSGFDTNVLLVEEDAASGIAVSDRGSFFISPGAQVSYAGHALGQDFESRYIASYTDYLNTVAQPFNSFYQRADLVVGKGLTHYGLFVDTYFLNKNSFSIYDWEAGVSWSRILMSSLTHSLTVDVPIQFQNYASDATLGSENDRTGGDLKIRATSRWIRGDAELITVQAGLDGQYTKGINYHQFGFDIPVQWVKPLPWIKDLGILNTFSLEAQGISYFQSETSRRDILFRAGAGALKTFFQSWNASLDYSFQQNVSNLEAARYIKGIISLQISRELI